MTTDRVAELWGWFRENAARLQGLDPHALVEEIYPRFSRVDERLGIEVAGELDAAGCREIILTAYALREALPIVERIAAAAPASLPGFRIVALRPAHGFGFTFQDDRGGFEGKDLRFVGHADDAGGLHVTLLVPLPALDEMPPGQREQLGWQMLNVGLGERLAARIDALEVVRGPGEGRPIEDLTGWLEAVRRGSSPATV